MGKRDSPYIFDLADLSSPSGSVWYAAKQEDMTDKHYHAWRLWKIDVPVDAEGWLEFCVRTWDSSNNTEPTYVRSAWKCVHYRPSCMFSSVLTPPHDQLGPPCYVLRSPYQGVQRQQVEVGDSCEAQVPRRAWLDLRTPDPPDRGFSGDGGRLLGKCEEVPSGTSFLSHPLLCSTDM